MPVAWKPLSHERCFHLSVTAFLGNKKPEDVALKFVMVKDQVKSFDFARIPDSNIFALARSRASRAARKGFCPFNSIAPNGLKVVCQRG